MTVSDGDSECNGRRLAHTGAEELLEEERRLHARVVARDELAMLECFDRSGHHVLCTALVQTGEASTAEDLTQGVFVEFWCAPEAFPPACGPLSLQMIRRLADRNHSREGESSAGAVLASAGRSA